MKFILKNYILVFGTFIVASEVITNITCEIKSNALLRRWQIIFGDMQWKYAFPEALARFARSLIIMMNVSDTVCLKLDVIVLLPLLFGGNHILVIFAENVCIRNCFFFRAQNAKISLPWEGTPSRTLPPLGRFAPSQFSSQITFGDMEI